MARFVATGCPLHIDLADAGGKEETVTVKQHLSMVVVIACVVTIIGLIEISVMPNIRPDGAHRPAHAEDPDDQRRRVDEIDRAEQMRWREETASIDGAVQVIRAALASPERKPLRSGRRVSWQELCADLASFESLGSAMLALAARTDGDPPERKAEWSSYGIERAAAEQRYRALGLRAAQHIVSVLPPQQRTSARPCAMPALDFDFRLTGEVLRYFDGVLKDAGIGVSETGIAPESLFQARVAAAKEDLVLIIDHAYRSGVDDMTRLARIQAYMLQAHAAWLLPFRVMAMDEQEYQMVARRIGLAPLPPQIIPPRPELRSGRVLLLGETARYNRGGDPSDGGAEPVQ